MNPSHIWEWIVWLVLAGGSVITLAIAGETLLKWARLRSLARSHARQLAAGRGLLLSPPHDETRRKNDDRRARADLGPLSLPLAQFTLWLLEPRATTDWRTAAEWKAAGLVDDLDRGRLNTLQAISRIAPLAALGGTVVGVGRSLAAFSGDPAAHAAVFAGLSLALFTTAAGVVVAIFSYSVGHGLEALLIRTEVELRELLLEVTSGRTPIAQSTTQAVSPRPVQPTGQADEPDVLAVLAEVI